MGGKEEIENRGTERMERKKTAALSLNRKKKKGKKER